jgi:hypothetical protein
MEKSLVRFFSNYFVFDQLASPGQQYFKVGKIAGGMSVPPAKYPPFEKKGLDRRMDFVKSSGPYPNCTGIARCKIGQPGFAEKVGVTSKKWKSKEFGGAEQRHTIPLLDDCGFSIKAFKRPNRGFLA